MAKIINSTIPDRSKVIYVERIYTTCPGYEQSVLELLDLAFKQSDTDFVRHSFGDNYIELTYKSMPTNMESIVNDVLTLDKLQRIKIDKED